MSGRNAKRSGGFTLIEVLVASLLLGMLMTILTMIFNSSSIAWRTGKAGVAELARTRKELAHYRRVADNTLPYATDNGESRVFRGVWDFDNSGREQVRTRAVDAPPGDGASLTKGDADAGVRFKAKVFQGGIGASSAAGFMVGVWSWGPDGKPDTEDDITTWPDVIESD